MVRKKRNIGIDLIKVIACILVVTLHSLSPVDPVVSNNTFNLSLYYVGTLAIPIFFMSSGYFVLNKRTISYIYSFKRIKNILIVVFSWLILYSVANLVIKHEFNFLNEIEGSIFTGVNNSHFYHFWFFWALIIMLLIAPILVWILQQGFGYFLTLTIAMTIICLIQDLSLHMGYTYLMRDTQQVFRIDTWLEYYLLGGIIGNSHFDQVKKYIKTHFLSFSVLDIFLYIVLVIYSLWNRKIIGWVYAEANYNNILVMLIAIISIILFTVSQPKSKNIIEYLIPATMGIYILQSFVIMCLNKILFFHIYPVLLIPTVFGICLIIVKIALKIPIVNRLFKL